jgi:hypothetical protein
MKTNPQTFLSGIVIGLVVTAACNICGGDTIYASDGFGTIKKFTPDGVGSVFATGPNGGPLAVDSAGNIYTGSGSTIVKFNPNGASSVFANTSPYSVEGLAFDDTGNLYASLYNITTYALKKFTPSGVGSTFANISSSPGDLAIDQSGNVYLQYVGGAIDKFTPSGVRTVFAGSNSLFKGTSFITFDGAGDLYGSGGYDIVKMTPDGIGSVFAADFAGADPGNGQTRGLAFDSTGNLFVGIFNYGVIDKFTPDGVSSLFANSSGIYLAVSPVAEPSSIVLAGTAFLVVALFALHHRRLFQNSASAYLTGSQNSHLS